MTFAELNKLAINYSDGVTVPETDAFQEFVAYAEEKKVPVLGDVDATCVAAFSDFYDKVWSTGKTDKEEE